MRNVFSKGRGPAQFLCIVLLGLSAYSGPVSAGFSNDPDCKAVSDAAKASATRIKEEIDKTAESTATAVAQSKNCVETVVGEANRSVPNFGGGLLGTLARLATDTLARQGCQILSNAQSRLTQQAQQAMQPLTNAANTVQSAVTQVNQAANQANQVINQANQAAQQAQAGQAPVAPVIPNVPNVPPTIWSRIANVF